jgi:hypothetical protein
MLVRCMLTVRQTPWHVLTGINLVAITFREAHLLGSSTTSRPHAVRMHSRPDRDSFSSRGTKPPTLSRGRQYISERGCLHVVT